MKVFIQCRIASSLPQTVVGVTLSVSLVATTTSLVCLRMRNIFDRLSVYSGQAIPSPIVLAHSLLYKWYIIPFLYRGTPLFMYVNGMMLLYSNGAAVLTLNYIGLPLTLHYLSTAFGIDCVRTLFLVTVCLSSPSQSKHRPLRSQGGTGQKNHILQSHLFPLAFHPL